jgi:peroxiredoxin
MPFAQAADLGSQIGNFQLPDVSGTTRSLQAYSGKIVVFVFWSFKCPVSLAYSERMQELQDKYADKGVVTFGIASAANESPAEIRANLNNLHLTVPVLMDSEGSLAEKLGATHTPSVFILDGDAILRYKGALDNNKNAGERGKVAYAEDAIDALLARRPVLVPETKPFGCGLRWRGIKE